MRKADGTGLKVAGGFGQHFEGFGDAELVLGEAGPVAEKSLGVLVEGREAELHVRSRATGPE